MRAAIARGLDYLEGAVGADGAWPSNLYLSLDLTGDPSPERPPFVAALGALSLGAVGGASVEGLLERTRAFLKSGMEHPGVWRYWPSLPPDLDDTAVCSLVLGWHGWLALGRTLPAVFRNRDPEGRFITWMARGDATSTWDDIDSVVNANVVAWLGDRPRTRGAQRWLRELIDENRERGASFYYPDEMDLYAALSRCGPLSPEGESPIAGLGPTIAARVMARLDPAGHFGDAQLTAQALSALDRLSAWPSRNDAARAVDHLLQTQCADGSWASGLVWQGPPPPNPPSAGFASPALITAYCVEALKRFVRRAA